MMKRGYLTITIAAIAALGISGGATARNCLTETPLPDNLPGYAFWTGVMQTNTFSGGTSELCRTLAAAIAPDGTVKAVESWGKNSLNTVNAGSFEFTGTVTNGVLTYTWTNGAVSTYTFQPDGNVKMAWKRDVEFRGETRPVKGEAVLTKVAAPPGR